MAKVFVELTMTSAVDGFTEASFHQEEAKKEGCWKYNKKNKNNNKMICVAEYKDEKWHKISYAVVNQNETGNALPWGKDASDKFRDFAQTEEICKRKILEFLNKNYADVPIISKDENIENDKRDIENTEMVVDTQNSQVGQDFSAEKELKSTTVIPEASAPATDKPSDSKQKKSEQHDKNEEKISETVYITELEWQNEWDNKKSTSKHKIKIDVDIQVVLSIRNQTLLRDFLSAYFATDFGAAERQALKLFICDTIFKEILNKNQDVLSKIIKDIEMIFANTIANKFKVSKPQNGDINSAVKKWKNEDPALFYSLFYSENDLARIDDFNRECNELNYITQKFALFELIAGNIEKAKIIVLNNNPGADYLIQSPQKTVDAINNFVKFLHIFVQSQQNSNSNNLKDVYYPFYRDFINLISDYFPKRFISTSKNNDPLSSRLFDSLLNGAFLTSKEKQAAQNKIYPERYYEIWEKVAPYVVSLERFGYHSRYFRKYEAQLQDLFQDQRDKVANVLQNALKKPLSQRPVIFVFRGKDEWERLLGEDFFEQYGKVYFVSNVQNPFVSEKQVGEENFKRLKTDWNALIDDKTLHLK